MFVLDVHQTSREPRRLMKWIRVTGTFTDEIAAAQYRRELREGIATPPKVGVGFYCDRQKTKTVPLGGTKFAVEIAVREVEDTMGPKPKPRAG
jgi:hypothetical protein